MNNLSLYLITVLIWGSTWLVINFQLGSVAPEVSIVYRFAIACFFLFGWTLLRGRKLSFGINAHVRFLLLGVFLFGFNYMVTYYAQNYIPSALNAVMSSAIMWMNVLNARLFFQVRIESRVYMGAALGMVGLLLIFWPRISVISLTDQTLLGAGLGFMGALIASVGNMVSHQAQRVGLPIIQSNAWGMLYGAAITAAVAWYRGLPFNFEYSGPYIGSLLYLAIFGSIAGFGCYLTLLGRIGPHKAGYAMVMFPVVAVLISVVFEGLGIEWHLLLGVALVLSGNLAVLDARKAAKRLMQSMATSRKS